MNNSQSMGRLRAIRKYANLSLENPLHPLTNKNSSVMLNLNYDSSNNNNSNNKLSLFSTTLDINSEIKRKDLYKNINVFHKRQFAFNKSIEDNKKVFKYKNFALFGDSNKNTRNKIHFREKKNSSNSSTGVVIDYSKFFLTDNENLLPILNTKNLTNEMISNIENNKSSFNLYKKNNQNDNGNNNIIKKQPVTKLKKRTNINIKTKLDIFTRIKKRSLMKNNFFRDLRDFLANKLYIKTREEKAKLISEKNEIKSIYLDNKISQLKENYFLFNNVFYNKFFQYLRYIQQIKQYEKDQDEIYVDNIIKLKMEINALQTTLTKINVNKNFFNRWMYLQIRMKEKKLELPESYKEILESKNGDKNQLIQKFGENLFNHVMQYKNNIIYKTADEFLNKYISYENKNLELLNALQFLREEIRNLEKEKNSINKNSNYEKNKNEYNEFMNMKIKELSHLKHENTSLKIYIEPLLYNKSKNKNKDYSIIKMNKRMYDKTNKIIQVLQENNYLFKNNIKYELRGNMTVQQKILYNLSQIEIIIDILIKKNDSYKKLYPEEIIIQKSLLDKEKKYLNNLEKIKAIKIKYEEERKKVIEKYNKIIILPTHKFNIDNRGIKKNTLHIKNTNKSNKNKNKTIEDINDIFN